MISPYNLFGPFDPDWTMEPPRLIADRIWKKYVRAYDGEIQGLCSLISDEIQKATGGEVVAGELTWCGGCQRRTHWWVEKDGEILDPMGDDLFSYEAPGTTKRIEAHRDVNVFYEVLRDWEGHRR